MVHLPGDVPEAYLRLLSGVLPGGTWVAGDDGAGGPRKAERGALQGLGLHPLDGIDHESPGARQVLAGGCVPNGRRLLDF